MDIIKKDYIFLDLEIQNQQQLFEKVAEISFENNLIKNKENLINAFLEREKIDSTYLEDGFAIPHARDKSVLESAVFFIRTNKEIQWTDKEATKQFILLVIPEGNGEYLDILSGIATKLMDKEFKNKLKVSTNIEEILELLKEKNKQKTSNIVGDDALTIVGVSACATGVAHTYMARDAILAAGKELNWNVYCETQGQKGIEFKLTDQQIKDADAVILATDISVDLERFANKKIYKVGTKALIADPVNHLRSAVSKGKKMQIGNDGKGVFDVKTDKAWIGHIMSGISYMIPFIVFAGIIFAVGTGIGKIVYGKWLDYNGDLNGLNYVQKNIHINSDWSKDYLTPNGDGTYTAHINGYCIAIFYLLNKFANVGFTVMIPVMGAYIANSIAGRSAIAPAFVLTWAGANTNLWLHWSFISDKLVNNYPSNGGGIFAALFFGFVIGYTIKWINTKWKIHRIIQPIMPIIIIPVFVSLIYGLITILFLGNIFGILIGYVNQGLQDLEATQFGMAGLGLILGLLAGVDMGGPINKIASFGATALIFTDGGKAMGCAAAAFAVAPIGCGLSTYIFKKRLKNDKPLGINALILGFMGISEGAIPFAVKYTWAVIFANIIGSGVAGMMAGLLHVSGWVGAWGGPIIALFGGVTSWDMSYIGILWYLLAIFAGVVFQIIIFRFLLVVKDNGGFRGLKIKNVLSDKIETENFVTNK
ncbi:PTS fructose transporter subunit IIABC [Spiroplasma endosymbiont of Crioceris asparagi]|uniref:PTS fructose transporter subunit IIABC n=1 Tax=Spiroplasma endosymbiont of Crioceris asparagi TaxID=3066286 RepID=UPI0030D224B4